MATRRSSGRYKSVYDYLLRLLATTAGRQNVTQALRLVSSVRADGTKLDRYTASLLAASHPADDLAVAFSGKAAEELRACLVHELVLRGIVVTETPGNAEWAASPHWRDHPLGWLPLTLSDVEDRPSMPRYSAHGVSHPMPYGPDGSRDTTIVAGTAGPTARETTTEATATAMAMAVANWAEESNGNIEARVFDWRHR